MASFAENFRAGADVVGAGLDRSLRAQQLRLAEAQQRMQERQMQQQAQMYLEQALASKAKREELELKTNLRKAAGENFAARVAAGESPDDAFNAATRPLAIADPESYIEMQKAAFQPSIVDLKDSTGQSVPVIRTSPSTVRQVRPATTTSSTATATMKELAQADEWVAQAAQREAAGDVAGAKLLRENAARLRAKHEKTGMTLETSPDGSVRFTQGGTPEVPMGVQTKVNERLAQTQKALDNLDDLTATLRPEDVGIKGVLGELVLDRTLPQFGFQTADVKRMDNRTKIATLRENLMRQVSADSRFSIPDRVAIEKFLPSSGIIESFEHTQQAAATLKRIFAKRALIDAQEAKMPPPAFALAALDDEALLEAVQAELLTQAQAVAAYRKRHAK